MTYAFHSLVHVRPGFESQAEEGRPDEADLGMADGFIERIHLRDLERPATYYYVSIWDSYAQLEDYRRSDAARRMFAQRGGGDWLAEPPKRVDCELLLHQRAPQERRANWAVHSTYRVRGEMRAKFDSGLGSDSEALAAAPGFVERLMLKDLGDIGAYHYLSLWESAEQNEAYRNLTTTQQRISDMDLKRVLASDLDRCSCAVVAHQWQTSRVS